MMNSIRLVALASVLALAAAGAQDTPVTPNLRGNVVSNTGTPIEGVEVRIDGSNLATHTDRRGSFAFINAPKGPQLVLFRLLGYLPTTAEARVGNDKDNVEVTMLATPHALDTVKVTASVHVLAGIVVDNKNKPVPGATLEMLADGNSHTTSDDGGWFTFTSVKSGSVLVRARKLGYEPVTTSIRLDDWRGMVIHMEPLDYNLTGAKLQDASGFGNASMFVWTETQQRLSQRGARAIVIPREELQPFDDYRLGDAIRRTKTGSAEAADLNAAGGDVCVLLNGARTVGPSTLQNFRTDDVEFVELYPPGTEISGSVARYLQGAGCRRVHVPGSFNVGAFYVVVWLR